MAKADQTKSELESQLRAPISERQLGQDESVRKIGLAIDGKAKGKDAGLPRNVSPALYAFVAEISRAESGEADQQQLWQYATRLVNSKSDPAEEGARGYRFADWTIREVLPLIYEAEGCGEAATQLRKLGPITDTTSAKHACRVVQSLRRKLYAAAAPKASFSAAENAYLASVEVFCFRNIHLHGDPAAERLAACGNSAAQAVRSAILYADTFGRTASSPDCDRQIFKRMTIDLIEEICPESSGVSAVNLPVQNLLK